MVTARKFYGKDALAKKKRLFWCRQISTQSLGATVRTNGKTQLTCKLKKVTQLRKKLHQVSHSYFISWMIKFKSSNIEMTKFHG